MKHRLSLFALLALLVSGCSIYHPQAVDIPLVNHRGDLQVDLSAGLSAWVLPDVLTLNTTASYGLNDWLATQAHLNYGFENVYGQLALGAYATFGSHGVVEGYLGTGLGGAWRGRTSYDADDDDDDDKSSGSRSYEYDGHFLLPFVQGNFGWRGLAGGHIDLAFGLKVGAYQPDFTYKSYNDDDEIFPSRTSRYTTPNLLLEPQFQFRVGGEHVKWNLRLGFAWMNDVYGADVNLTYDWLTLSTGLTFFF